MGDEADRINDDSPALLDQRVVGISTPSTPASPEPKVAVGQHYKSKDKRRVSTIIINRVNNAYGGDSDTVEGSSLDPVTNKTKKVTILTVRLLSKYTRVS